MDIFLGKVTAQAMNYAIRSGITITTTYAIKQCGRLLKETPRSQQRSELLHLQLRLESKIRIISPAIDMIDLISARGNTTLESAVSLTKEIRYEMQRLGRRLDAAANDEELLRRNSRRAERTREQTERELQSIITCIKHLLDRLEDAVPLLNLAITTSGVSLSSKLSGSVSPSRLLQASTFLSGADGKFAAAAAGAGAKGRRQQVGPTYTLSLYMLFAGHAFRGEDEGAREMTWKEVVHKARVKVVRVALEDLYELPGGGMQSSGGHAGGGGGGGGRDSIPSEAEGMEFAYQLVIVEDLDDDRVHTFEDSDQQPAPFEDVANAGIRDVVPIHEVSKIFYADTGKILNIGRDDSDTNNPVLLLRRNVHAEPPRRMLQRSQMSAYDLLDDSLVNGGMETIQGAGDDKDDDEQSEIDSQLHRESISNTPIGKNKPPPSRKENTSAAWRLPLDLDPEWMAFEVYTEDPTTSDDDDEAEEEPASTSPSHPPTTYEDSPSLGLTGALSKLNLATPSPSNSPSTTNKTQQIIPTTTTTHPPANQTPPSQHPRIKTSLSLLEMLLKLTALQQFRQDSHLAIEDEVLNFFLEDTSTAGADADGGLGAGVGKESRRKVRQEAVKRVGFDPYDESPVKRRGEEYIRQAGGGGARGGLGVAAGKGFDVSAFEGSLPYYDERERYGHGERGEESAFVHPSIEVAGEDFPSSPGGIWPSSPSPVAMETPPRETPPLARQQSLPSLATSTPASNSLHRNVSAQGRNSGVGGVASRTASQTSLLATPPSTSKSKVAFLDARGHQSEGRRKGRSPLGKEIVGEEEGEGEGERER